MRYLSRLVQRLTGPTPRPSLGTTLRFEYARLLRELADSAERDDADAAYRIGTEINALSRMATELPQ